MINNHVKHLIENDDDDIEIIEQPEKDKRKAELIKESQLLAISNTYVSRS